MIFFPSGDKELGIDQLKNAATNGKYSMHEARYFLMNLYYNFESDYVMAEYYGDILTESFPNNAVFERWRGRIAVKRSDWFTADSVFKSVLEKAKKNFTGYNTLKVKREAEYYVAYQFKNLNEWEKSFNHFKKCIDYSKQLSEEKESGFLINATLFAGTALEMQKKYDEAKKYYNKVLGMKDFNNSIGMAKNYLARIENLSNQKKN
jgi:tetratricopeptide (TPR) repeat protein